LAEKKKKKKKEKRKKKNKKQKTLENPEEFVFGAGFGLFGLLKTNIKISQTNIKISQMPTQLQTTSNKFNTIILHLTTSNYI